MSREKGNEVCSPVYMKRIDDTDLERSFGRMNSWDLVEDWKVEIRAEIEG
jgi:hypothetical protein